MMQTIRQIIEELRRHPTAVAFGGVSVIIATILIVALSTAKPGSGTGPTQPGDPQATTSFYGSLAGASDSFLVNYGGGTDPNYNAVHQSFHITALDKMPLPSDIKTLLPNYLPQVLSAAIAPTYAATFIQIDRSTIKCPDSYDCRFSFYVDSPESYFDFHLYYQPNGTRTYDLKQQPLPGVDQ